jgi:hypothetical protein
MIVNKNILTFIFCTLFLLYNNNTITETATNSIAEDMNYHHFVRDLHNKVNNHLALINEIIQKNIAALRAAHHQKIADEKAEEYRQQYLNLSRLFDDEFENFDRRLVLNGLALDSQNASIQEKEIVIAQNRHALAQDIERLIESSAAHFLQ